MFSVFQEDRRDTGKGFQGGMCTQMALLWSVCACVWSDGPSTVGEAVRCREAAGWRRCSQAVAVLYGGGPCFMGTPTPSS